MILHILSEGNPVSSTNRFGFFFLSQGYVYVYANTAPLLQKIGSINNIVSTSYRKLLTCPSSRTESVSLILLSALFKTISSTVFLDTSRMIFTGLFKNKTNQQIVLHPTAEQYLKGVVLIYRLNGIHSYKCCEFQH